MWQSSSPGLPDPHALPPRCPFPIKSLALSAHVSPWTIHFRGLDKSPVSGPGRGPPSYNTSNDYSGLISFRMEWLDLLAVKGLSRVFSNTTVQKHHFLSDKWRLNGGWINGGWLLTRLQRKASLVAHTMERLPAMRETWVQALGQEDPLEREMATQSSTPF